MKNQKTSRELSQQNKQPVKKLQKHDANLQKNSTLYFQIGLILCLLAAFGLLEMKFEKTIPNFSEGVYKIDDTPDDMALGKVKIFTKAKAELRPKTKKVKFVNKVIVTDKNKDEMEKALDIVEPVDSNPSDPILDPSVINVEGNPEDGDEDLVVPFVAIQNVPVYPGCEKKKSNFDKRKCMSDKINKLIRKKFNGSIASDYGLSGRQKIHVQFLIDRTGQVTGIQTKAAHPALEKEAKRVVNKIPEMQPGKQRDKAVSVKYNLPITFMVQ